MSASITSISVRHIELFEPHYFIRKLYVIHCWYFKDLFYWFMFNEWSF